MAICIVLILHCQVSRPKPGLGLVARLYTLDTVYTPTVIQSKAKTKAKVSASGYLLLHLLLDTRCNLFLCSLMTLILLDQQISASKGYPAKKTAVHQCSLLDQMYSRPTYIYKYIKKKHWLNK